MSLLPKSKNSIWFYEHSQSALDANGALFLEVFENSRDLRRSFSDLEVHYLDRLCGVLSEHLLCPPRDWGWQEVTNLPNFVSVFDRIAKKKIRKPLKKFPVSRTGLLYDNKGMEKGGVQSLIIKAVNLSEGYFRIYSDEKIQKFYLNNLDGFEVEAAE
ncbi:MAG: hypothetical protein ABJO36_09835 [Litorimonas sp.]